MATLVRIQRKGQVTIPARLRSAAGVTEGDMVEASVQRGKIVLAPKVVTDPALFPNANDEYTLAQRRIIDARLDESEEDLKKGRTLGPFNSADEMILHMKAGLKKSAAKKPSALVEDRLSPSRAEGPQRPPSRNTQRIF